MVNGANGVNGADSAKGATRSRGDYLSSCFAIYTRAYFRE